MFSLFRRKPKYTTEEMFEQLGEFSNDITSAASETENLFIAIKGSGAVVGIIGEAKQKFGLKVEPNTVFHEFASAVQQQKMSRMVEMIKEMANALGQVEDVKLKGALVHFWFNGESQMTPVAK